MRERTSKAFVFSALIFVVCLLICSYLYKESAPRRKAREIWREHERVIVDAAQGRHVGSNELWDASLFFWRLTGIDVPSDHSSVIDAIPNKRTGLAAEPLRRWYQENKYRLYWDEKSGEVLLGRKSLAPWAVLP